MSSKNDDDVTLDVNKKLAALTIDVDVDGDVGAVKTAVAIAHVESSSSGTTTTTSSSRPTNAAQPSSLLPADIISIALLYVDIHDVPRVARTCKEWKTALSSVEDELWISILRRHNAILSRFSSKVRAVLPTDDKDKNSLEPSPKWKKLFRRAYLLMRMNTSDSSYLSLDFLERGAAADPPYTATIVSPRPKSFYDININIRLMGDRADYGYNGQILPITRNGSQMDDESGMLRLDVPASDLHPGPGLVRGFVWATLRHRDARTEQVIWRCSYKNNADRSMNLRRYRWKDRDIVVDGKRVAVFTSVVAGKVNQTGHVDFELRFDMEWDGERYEELCGLEVVRLWDNVLFGGPRTFQHVIVDENERNVGARARAGVGAGAIEDTRPNGALTAAARRRAQMEELGLLRLGDLHMGISTANDSAGPRMPEGLSDTNRYSHRNWSRFLSRRARASARAARARERRRDVEEQDGDSVGTDDDFGEFGAV